MVVKCVCNEVLRIFSKVHNNCCKIPSEKIIFFLHLPDTIPSNFLYFFAYRNPLPKAGFFANVSISQKKSYTRH